MPDLPLPLLPKLVVDGLMFFVEPVFLPFELLDRSRKSLDLGFGLEARAGFFEAFCVLRSAFRVSCSVFCVPRSVLRVTCS